MITGVWKYRGKSSDTVTIKADAAQTATVYTYNASAGNFSFSNVSNNTSEKAGDVAASLLPPAGQTASGVYKAASGEVNFDVDANGKITIGGQKAYLTSDGNLTTNDAGGATAATLDGLFKKAGDGQSIGFKKTASVTMGGTTYNFKTGADADAATANAGVSFTDTASKETVLNKVATAKQGKAAAADGDTSATITYKSGVQTYQAVFAAGDGTASAKYADKADVSNATATYTDADGEMTTIGSYTTKYSIDANNGKVTVDSGTGTGKYAPKVGAEVYVSANGTLTTDATSEGTVTKDPLKALDEAISSIDKFRSSLGAIQNRLDSAVTNLNNTTTNLSEAQSRIQDADYATEVSNMSKAQIIQQAGNSVLAKANQVPQQVLSLLQG